jgi:Protein of unknown function (DUF2505)
MAELNVEHAFGCSEDTFWDKVFFDDEYNQRLFERELRFPVWRVLGQNDDGTEIVRRIEVVPYVGELPGPLKALIGEGVGYEEVGHFDKARRRYHAKVRPNKLADKVSVEIDLWTVATGQDSCRRCVKATVKARLLGVGGMLEKRLVADLERSYAKSATFTNTFVEEKGLSGG